MDHCTSDEFAERKRALEVWLASAGDPDFMWCPTLANAYGDIIGKLSPRFRESDVYCCKRPDFYKSWIATSRDKLPEPFRSQLNIVPFAIELTAGCSVGCWYCGVTAGRLSLPPPLDSKRLRRTLVRCQKYFGAWGGSGLLYWATDPLDHPEYHIASDIFYDVFGCRPFVSTAIASRRPETLEVFIKQLQSGELRGLRITVKSRRELEHIFEMYTKTQTSRVIIDFKCRSSITPIMNTGRAARAFELHGNMRNKEIKKRAMYYNHVAELNERETISCVLGPVISLATSQVRIVEPSVDKENLDGTRTLWRGALDDLDMGRLLNLGTVFRMR